ncbi:MAG: archaellin/type IV pilin N-terminal domain-containing protein [Candidatus Woesearchaeota archaeon]
MNNKKTKNICFLKKKKGVSPLIATVLLIAFAVALGAVVMNWGRSYVEETATYAKSKSETEVRCSMDVRIEGVKSGQKMKVCYNNSGGLVNFVIRNSGEKAVEKLLVHVLTTDNQVHSKEINQTIPVGTLFSSNSNYTGNFEQLEIIPNIYVSGQYIPCTEANLVFHSTEINECS